MFLKGKELLLVFQKIKVSDREKASGMADLQALTLLFPWVFSVAKTCEVSLRYSDSFGKSSFSARDNSLIKQ